MKLVVDVGGILKREVKLPSKIIFEPSGDVEDTSERLTVALISSILLYCIETYQSDTSFGRVFKLKNQH